MNKNHILLLTLSLFAGLVQSCGKTTPDPEQEAWNGYITFEAGVRTKTPIITDLTAKNFDVVAYEYDTDWARSKARAVPTDKFDLPTKVDCNGAGACSYDASHASTGKTYVPWAVGKYYSFFAFYPDHGTSGIDLGTTNTSLGVPYITYTAPMSGSPDGLLDVMTSYVLDKNSTGDGAVYFEFDHRLALLTIDALNLNDYDEYIRNLTIQFDAPLYNMVRLPLDGSTAEKTWSTNATYDIGVGNVSIPEQDNPSQATMTHVSEGKNITLIPITRDEVYAHTGNASLPAIKGTLRFQRKVKDEERWEDEDLPFSSESDILEGKKYSLLMSFSEDVITLSVIASGDWLTMDQTITFE